MMVQRIVVDSRMRRFATQMKDNVLAERDRQRSVLSLETARKVVLAEPPKSSFREVR